jgi:flavin-dependent dehydrogenase
VPARVVPSAVDAVVIGGGPAGAAVARQLAAWGHDVVVLPGPPARRPCIAESLPPSCRKPLAALGLLEEVEAAGFHPTRGNSAAWAESELRAQEFAPGETGFQVERGRLDELLLASAASAGARVVPHGRAGAVEWGRDPDGSPLASVPWSGAGEQGSLRTRWVLDCSGRAGVLARRGLRRREAAPATTALLGVWRRTGAWPMEDPSHTLVESYADGWVWSVPVDSRRRYVAAMIDPRLTATRRSAGLDGMYFAELAKTRHLSRLLDGASPEGPVWACAATRYSAARHAGDGFLLVGDAGCFLDPLSSFGVKKALASGYLAAVVTRTCLLRGEMRAAALNLFEERERAASAGYAAQTARHYAEAAEAHPHPFWRARASTRAAPAEPEALPAGDPRLGAALESLRAARVLRLRAAAGLRRVRRPTVEGGEVVLGEHLASHEAPQGIRHFRGVELPALLDLAASFRRVPDLFEAYARSRRPVPLPDFLFALSMLLALGMLEHQSDT